MRINKILENNNIPIYGETWNELDPEFREKYSEYVDLLEELPDGNFSDVDEELVQLFFEKHEIQEPEPEEEFQEPEEELEDEFQEPDPKAEILKLGVLNKKQMFDFGIINDVGRALPKKFEWKGLVFENKSQAFTHLFFVKLKNTEFLFNEWHVSENGV